MTDIFAAITQPPWTEPVIRMQMLVPESVFQNVPHVISDMAIGVRSGMRRIRFSELTIRLGQTTVTNLSSTLPFAANITSPLQDVLVVRDHVWQGGFGPDWIPLGLQHAFQFLPGHGPLLVEIVFKDRTVIENLGFVSGAASLIGTGVVGGGATVPTLATSYLIYVPAFRFCVDRAETMLLGETCNGSAGSTPLLGVTGRPTPGASPTIWLSDAPANALAACAYGFDNQPPYPISLTPLGAPGCRQYFPVAYADIVLANPVGVGQRAVLIPNTAASIGTIFYTQYYVLDPPANALDLTASNYARLLVGL